jgi:predicted secreted protein
LENDMSNADIGYDSEFAIESTTPGTYTKVAEVVAITPPGMSRDAVEVTHLESAERWKQYIAGLKDGGEASITLNFVASATDALLAAFNAETGGYQITFPNGIRMQFDGFCTAYNPPELTPGGVMQSTATFKCSGAVTMLAAS